MSIFVRLSEILFYLWKIPFKEIPAWVDSSKALQSWVGTKQQVRFPPVPPSHPHPHYKCLWKEKKALEMCSSRVKRSPTDHKQATEDNMESANPAQITEAKGRDFGEEILLWILQTGYRSFQGNQEDAGCLPRPSNSKATWGIFALTIPACLPHLPVTNLWLWSASQRNLDISSWEPTLCPF